MTGKQRCDGCLGSRSCWVCLGHGSLPTRSSTSVLCGRCGGTGICAVCEPRVLDLRAADVQASA